MQRDLTWMERCRSALAGRPGGPVLDACVFGRAGSLLGGANPLGAPLASLVSRRRAGGLPERFALVLRASCFSSAARGAFTEVIFETNGTQIAVRAARGERTDAFLRSLRDSLPR